MNFLFPHFFCLLSATLIGWLVGWLLGRLGRGRPSETLDVELAGKMRLLEDERNRQHVENDAMKSSLHQLRAQLDKSNTELSETRALVAERNALRGELEAALTKLSLMEQTGGTQTALHAEADGTRRIIETYASDLKKSEEIITLLQRRIGELRWLKWNLKNIEFPVDSHEITIEATENLEDVAAVLKGLNGVHIEVAGHTDNVDSEQHNRELSQRRAENVRAFLIDRGIPAHKLVAVGYGAGRPVADNTTDEGRRRNRRIEFEVTKGNS